MPEGLSAMEAEHERSHHAHHSAAALGPHGRTLQVAEAVVLALVTITAAWSGFAAAKWGTESRLQLAAAGTARTEANREYSTAQSQRDYDAATFNAWFTAFTLGSEDTMALAERRFRPEYQVAFDAWRATDPEHNPDAPGGPALMPQYRIEAEAQAAELDAAADEHASQGERAGIVGDQYIRITVVLAGVLFLVGIGSTFTLAGVRYGLLGLGAVLLVIAEVLIFRQPGPPA